MNRYALASLWTITFTILDQGTKALVLNKLPLWASRTVIPGFFNIVHVHNKGTAWGVLDRNDITWQVPLLIAITIAALGFIAYMLQKTEERDKWMVSGLGLIGGGALGNLIDRIRLGEVVDFLDFYIGNYHWPAFNVADSALTLGAGAILISMYLNRNNASAAS